jgi:hypothetical protein
MRRNCQYLLTDVKPRALRYCGHIERMKEEKLLKNSVTVITARGRKRRKGKRRRRTLIHKWKTHVKSIKESRG